MQHQFQARRQRRPGSHYSPDFRSAAWIWLLATLAGVLVAAGVVAAWRMVALAPARTANDTLAPLRRARAVKLWNKPSGRGAEAAATRTGQSVRGIRPVRVAGGLARVLWRAGHSRCRLSAECMIRRAVATTAMQGLDGCQSQTMQPWRSRDCYGLDRGRRLVLARSAWCLGVWGTQPAVRGAGSRRRRSSPVHSDLCQVQRRCARRQSGAK
jgi:hypothetical protein